MKKVLFFLCVLILYSSQFKTYSENYRNVALDKDINEVEPLKGIVFWPDNDKINEYKNSIALEFSYCLPSKIVTGKSNGKIQYNWSSFESLLNDISKRGHQAIIRFRYEYPNSKDVDGSTKGMTAVPNYIKALSDYNETYSKNPGGDGPTYYADWSNSELQWFTKQFYTDFAEKYDNDPRIAFLQVGFGHWSEYHIYGSKLQLGINFPSYNYQIEFLNHLNNTFTHTPWNISIDAADDEYTPITNNEELMALRFGLFDDSFMHKDHDIGSKDGYNEECWNKLNRNRWKVAPAGGEFSYYEDKDQHNALNPVGMYGATWEERAAQYHMTYVIGNDVTEGSYATTARVKEASMNSGYRFQITKYQVSNIGAKITVKNIGIAPIYHDAYITIKNMRAEVSLKGLLPNEEKEYTVDVSINTTENLEPTITSDKILNGRTIPFQAKLTGDMNGVEQNVSNITHIKQVGNTLYFAGSNYKVSIFNLSGIELISSQEESLNISSLPSGYYIVKYIGNNKEIETMKICKF